MSAQPSGEKWPAGPCPRHRVGAPRAVTTHCRRTVARSVWLVGGFPGDKILTLTIGELRGDGRERCWEAMTHLAVGQREGGKMAAGGGI
jgi:hypothetical protein